MGVLSNLVFSALLAMCPGRVLAAEIRDWLQEKKSNNGDIQVCDRTVEVEDEIHTRMLSRPFTTRVRAGTSCPINPWCHCVSV